MHKFKKLISITKKKKYLKFYMINEVIKKVHLHNILMIETTTYVERSIIRSRKYIENEIY